MTSESPHPNVLMTLLRGDQEQPAIPIAPELEPDATRLLLMSSSAGVRWSAAGCRVTASQGIPADVFGQTSGLGTARRD